MKEKIIGNESSHKSAKLGNSTTKSIIAIVAVSIFLLSVTFASVSAQDSATTKTDNGHTFSTTITETTTSTSFVCCQTTTTTLSIATTTSPVCCQTVTSTVAGPTVTTTETSSVTSTETDTTTTTSAVCCQTITSTTTEPASTTTAVSTTTAEQVSSGASFLTYSFSGGYNQMQKVFAANSGQCVVTISLETQHVADTGANVYMTWYDTQDDSYSATVASGTDVSGFTATVPAAAIYIIVEFSSSTSEQVLVFYTWTAICP